MSKEPTSIRKRLDRSTSRSASRTPSRSISRTPSRSPCKSADRSPSKSVSRSPSRTPTPVSKKDSPRGSRSVSKSPSGSSSSSLSASSSESSRSSRSSRSGARKSRSKSRSPASGDRSRSRSKSSELRRRSPTPVTRIHINKLTRNVNKQHLLEIFKTYGPIKNVDVQTDRFHPQLCRGSAYIEFEKSVDAEKAIKYMDGGQIDGQEIIVTKFRYRNANHRPQMNHRRVGAGFRNGGAWRRYSPARR